MNLHEYQGKLILKSYGVAIQEGIVVERVEDALAAAKELTAKTGTSWYVIKAQIHAGGRGKGTIEETGSQCCYVAGCTGAIELHTQLEHFKDRVAIYKVPAHLAPLSLTVERLHADDCCRTGVCVS